MDNTNTNVKVKYKKQNRMLDLWKQFSKNKTAVLGLIIIVLFFILAASSGFIFDFQEDIAKQNIPNRFKEPSMEHLFGTDDKGREVFYRTIYASRISLTVGLAAVAVALFVGGILGSMAGYFGGLLDNIIMRIMDIFLAIPGTLFAITIVAALGKSTTNLIIALSIATVPQFARILRGSVLTVRDKEYIEASRAIGASNLRIITQHVIPNALAPVIVQSTLSVANIILTIAGLSFLGLGVSPPTPEWGGMLADGKAFIRNQSYLAFFPGVAIMITILALNLLGDGLRDALDPRLR